MSSDTSLKKDAEQEKRPAPEDDSSASEEITSRELLSRQLFLDAPKQLEGGIDHPSEEPFGYCMEMFDSAPLGYVNLDNNGIIKGINLTGAMLLAEERPALLGKPFHLYVAEDDRQRFFSHLQHCRESSQRITTDVRIASKNGDTLDVHLVSSPYVDFTTNEPLYRTAITDITELKRSMEEVSSLNAHLSDLTHELEVANTELKEANEELVVFNYSASHDLRGPLTTISLYGQLIMELYSNKLDEQGRAFTKGIVEQTARMSELLTCLLELSHFSHKELKREEVDLSTMARGIAAMLRLKQPERNVEFRIAEGMVVNGDKPLIQIVLDNLLGNAWKYTGKKKAAFIEFGVTEENGTPTYFVRDNGVGFDMDQAHKLFEVFKRLDRHDEYEGFGIGLALVQRIIHRHGGDIRAEGGLGKGAVFDFTLA